MASAKFQKTIFIGVSIMKNFFYLLLFIVSFFALNFTSNSQKLDDIYFQRTLTDYKGVVAHENTILTYGDYGILTVSFDLGENWEQKYLGEKHNINQIIKTEFGFYGVSNFAVFYSNNYGKSWRFYNFDNEIDAISLAHIGNNICVLTNESILFFDLSLNYQKSISLDFSKRPVKMIANDRYLFITDSTRAIRRFDTKTDIDDYVYIPRPDTIYTYSNRLDPFNFFVDKNQNLIAEFRHIDVNLFKSTNNGDNWDVVSPEFRWYHGRSIYIDGFMYNFYGRYKTRSDKIDASQYLAIDTNKLTFKRFEKAYHETRLNTDSSVFDFNYNTDVFNLIQEVFDYTFTKDSIIILVGKYSSILMSYDNGKTWKLKSHINNQILNTNASYNFEIIYSNKNFHFLNLGLSHSTNKGATWCPEFIDIGTNVRFQIFGFNRLVTNDENLYISGIHKVSNNNLHKLIQSKSKKKLRLKLDSMNFSYLINQSIINRPSGDIVVNYASYYIDGNYFEVNFIDKSSITFVYDKNFDVIDYFIIPDINFYWISLIENKLVGLANFSQKIENGQVVESSFYIVQSLDSGKTWSNPLKVNGYNPGNICQPFVFEKKILLNWYNTDKQLLVLVEYDPLSNSIKEVLEYTDSQMILNKSLISISDMLVHFTEKGYFINKNPQLDLTNWEYHPMTKNSYEWIEYDRFFHHTDSWNMIQNAFSFEEDDPLLIIQDKPGRTGGVRINFMKVLTDPPLSVENAETETPRSRAFLHAGKPYPLPAVSTVSSDLQWNAQYSAQEAVLKVFDSMGNEIPNAQVELQQTNPYSGTVTWDCGAYPTGIYFIQVTIGTEQKNVGVAVVR